MTERNRALDEAHRATEAYSPSSTPSLLRRTSRETSPPCPASWVSGSRPQPSLPAMAYPVDCAILLCLAGGWPASAECAHARAVFIRRITPWPIEPPLQIWNCPMRASFRGEAKPIERLFDIAFAVSRCRSSRSRKRRSHFSLSRIGRMSTSPTRRLTSSARSACSRSPTSSEAHSDGDCNSWGVCTWAPMALRATTAVVGAAFLRCRPPQTSPCRRTVAAIGTGRSSSSGATMKAATDTKRFTTENLNDPPPKRSKDVTPRNRNDARP
jgi:hypothetical protein